MSWFFTLTNAGIITNQPPDQTVPEWLLKCTCTLGTCQCHAKLRPDIMCIIGAPNQTQTPILPSPNYTIQFIEFTYCHDRFPEQAHTHKHTKYDPLTTTLQDKGWKTNPLITITVGVRGDIHENSIEQLIKLKVLKTHTKTLMKNIHQNTIKYLTYLVLNKRKLDNKQTHVPHHKVGTPPPFFAPQQSPPPNGGITSYIASQSTVISTGLTGSYSRRYKYTGVIFSFLFFSP